MRKKYCQRCADSDKDYAIGQMKAVTEQRCAGCGVMFTFNQYVYTERT